MEADSGVSWKSAEMHAWHGLLLAVGTLAVTSVVEVYSYEAVGEILRRKSLGKKAYLQAIGLNLVNHVGFGVPVYTVGAVLFCRERLSWPGRACAAFGILCVHSVCYYTVHQLLHTKALYRFHRFHHRFNEVVSPFVANAVHPVEYLFAYVLPFTLATLVCGPDPFALVAAVLTISITNIGIHTPKFEDFQARLVPSWWVSTRDHLQHHSKLKTKYAAPTFNLDYFHNLIFTHA